jgi:hypothetical protein
MTAASLRDRVVALAALALLLLLAFALPSYAVAPCADMKPDLSCCEDCLAANCLCAARSPAPEDHAISYERLATLLVPGGAGSDLRTGSEPQPLRRPPRITDVLWTISKQP